MEIFGVKLLKETQSGALWYQVKNNKKHPLFKKINRAELESVMDDRPCVLFCLKNLFLEGSRHVGHMALKDKR